MLSSAAVPSRGASAWAAFACGAIAVVLASRAVVESAGFQARPRLLGLAVAADLTITVSFLAWIVLVRTGRASPTFLLATLSAGAWAATRIVPLEHAASLSTVARLVVTVAELALLALVVRGVLQVRRAVRESQGALAFEELLRSALARSVGCHRGIDAALTELSFVGMALFSWRSVPHVPPAATPYTVHARSGVGAVHAALALASIGEAAGMHLLLAQWSVRVAWGVTALSLWAMVWLVGDHRALKLRPVLLERDRLRVRVGLRWRADVPLNLVCAVCAGPDPARHRGAATATPLGAPNVYLHLAAPIAIEGILGLRRRGDCVGIRVDDPEALRRALLHACPELVPTASDTERAPRGRSFESR